MLWASVQILARRSLIGLTGLLMAVVGLVFMTLALWHLLVLWGGPVAAALVLGLLFTGIGFVLIAASRPLPPPAVPVRPATPFAGMVDAFLTGLAAGASSRRRPPG